MGILRIVVTGYGNQLFVGRVTEQQKGDFEQYCTENDLDMNEIWYDNENDEMEEFFDVDDCMDVHDFDVEGVAFKDKTDLDAFAVGRNSSVEIRIYLESPIDNQLNVKEIETNVSDITFRRTTRKTPKRTDESVSVYYGNSCNGHFDCIFPVFEDFDPEKLVLNYQDWGEYGYIISSAQYDKDKDDFCFKDGDFIDNFDLRFE